MTAANALWARQNNSKDDLAAAESVLRDLIALYQQSDNIGSIDEVSEHGT